MKQLNGLDSVFVHAEQHGLPMHISSFSIYDPSTATFSDSSHGSADKQRVQFKQIVEFYQQTIVAKLPILRSKLVKVPMNLDQPYWLEDPNFNIDYHMRFSSLPAPGNWDTLCDLLANLHSQPLQRHHPLWEAHIIDGLHTAMDVPTGCFGVLFKVHHSIMDGERGMEIFTALHSMDSHPTATPNQEQALSVTPVDNKPGNMALANLVYKQNTARTYKLIKTLSRTLSTYKKLRKGIDEQRLRIIENKPKTRFNGDIGSQRVITRIEMPFSDIRNIKSLVAGAKVNDVALAIIGGAFRRYLAHHGELPNSSLVASIPINVRSKHSHINSEGAEQKANVVSVMNCVLATDIADPKARLEEVFLGSQQSKAFADEMGHDLLNDLSDCMYAPVASWGLKKLIESGVLSHLPPASHTIVTNVPGIPIPFYLCGCKLVDAFGLGPLIPNTGIFHTVSSTYDRFSISVVADKVMMPDPGFYQECMQGSLHELISACEPRAIKKKKSSRAPKKSTAIADLDKTTPLETSQEISNSITERVVPEEHSVNPRSNDLEGVVSTPLMDQASEKPKAKASNA